MDNVPAENFVVCCLTVSCRTHCPCSLAHSLILQFSSCPWALRELYLIFQSRKTDCKLWNGIIGFPVDEVVGRPVCYSLKKSFIAFPKSPQWSSKLGANLANLDLHTGLASQMNSKVTEQSPRRVRNSTVPTKGVTSLKHTSWISHIRCSSLTVITTKRHGKTGGKWIFTKRHFFFSFLTLNKPAILKKPHLFLLISYLKSFVCLLCFINAYKITCFYTLVSKYFVIYTLTIAKKALYASSS